MRKNVIFFIIVMFILVGCAHATKKGKDKEASHDVDVSGEQMTVTYDKNKNFRVISTYELVEEYIQQMEGTEDSKHDELWQEIVTENTIDDCLSGIYSHLVTDYIETPLKNTTTLKMDMDALIITDVEKTTMEALEDSAKMFPGPETTVCLFPQGNDMYFSGVTLDAGKISIFHSASLKEEQLKWVIAHEYHHSTWTKRYSNDNEQWNLLESVIFEGKANYFASIVTEQRPTYNIDREQEEELWNRTKDRLDSTNRGIINNVLYGGDDVYPSDYGYFLGYQIVHEYAEKHPEASIEKWSELSSQEIYENSGYGDSF